MPRALRKWKEANPGKPPPVDRIIRLRRQWRNLEQGAKSMGRGVDTVMDELKPWLASVPSESDL